MVEHSVKEICELITVFESGKVTLVTMEIWPCFVLLLLG